MEIRALSTSNYYNEENLPLTEPLEDVEALLEETLLEEPADTVKEFNESPETTDEGISLKDFMK